MPARNIVKQFDTNSFYHVYNRGAGKQPIFLDAQDKRKFMQILKRHLDSGDEQMRSDGRKYEVYDVELAAYCLMKNHFHLLLFQRYDIAAMTKLLHSVQTAYTMYFNFRYKRQGHLFQGIYKASRIEQESYLSHVSRYIHLNPRTYQTYKWSSLPEFLTTRETEWIHPERVLDMSPSAYQEFMEDYEDRKALLDLVKSELGL